MNVDALKSKATELSTKVKTGAAEFVQESKVKADALKEKAGEAIANAKRNKEARNSAAAAAADADPAVVSDTEGDSAHKRTSKIREGLAGVAAKLKSPNVRVEEGSIADILLKAKAKVFRKGGGDDGAATEGADTTDIVAAADVPADYDAMKAKVDDLASEMETTANDKESPKEKVQKNLIVIFSKLKVAQDKFVAMVEAKKQQKAEAAAAKATEGETATATDGEATPAANENEKAQKLKNLLSSAETAARKAFENAERVARETAKKTGLFDGESKRASAAETLSGIADAHAEPMPAAEEPKADGDGDASKPPTTTTEPEFTISD